MAGVRIRVGASLDSSALKVFEPLEQRAARASKNIQKSLNTAVDGRSVVAGAKHTADALEHELDAAANRLIRDEEKTQGQRTRLVDRGARDRVKIETKAANDAAKAITDANGRMRDSKGRFLGGGGGGAIGIGRRAAISVGRGAAIGYGLSGRAIASSVGLAEEIAQGMGIDLSVASHMANAQETQRRVAEVVNAGYIPGAAGAQGQLQNRGEVQADIFKAADAGAFSHNDVAGGLQKFVGLTGDLETGRKSLEAMARLSRATGTNFEDMEMAAGEVSNHLENVPDKAAAIEQVMRIVAGQGKLGAVEIRDMAHQMAKIASQAGKFEGGTAKNIGDLGILAQESKLRGGSASAVQAATAVVSFASDITKGTTLKHWAGAHLSPFTDSSKTTLRSPEELIMEALKYSKGDLTKLGNLFPNKQSMRAVAGFAAVYRDHHGDEKSKLEAVTAEFDHLRAAQLTAEEVQRAYTEAVHTGESAAQLANNKLDEMASSIQAALIPALAGFAPALEAIIPLFTELTGSLAALIKMVTGAASKEAEDKAGALKGKLGADEKLVQDSKGSVFVPGKGMVPTYSGQALDVVQAHGHARTAAIGALEGQIAVKEAQASEYDEAAKGDHLGIQARLAHAVGGQSAAEHATAARAEATRMREELQKATQEAVQSNQLLENIYAAIQSGNAQRIDTPPTPPPPPNRAGTTSPDSDGPNSSHE